MSLPLALATASGESRGRSGPVDVTVSSTNVDTHSDSWEIWKGIGDASLLLSPDGSYDQNGPVAPTIGAGVTVDSTQYGDAWNVTYQNGDIRTAVAPLDPAEGTILVRMTPTEGAPPVGYLWSIGSRLLEDERHFSARALEASIALRRGAPYPSQEPDTVSPAQVIGEWHVMSLTWGNNEATVDFGTGGGPKTVSLTKPPSWSGEIVVGGLEVPGNEYNGLYAGLVGFSTTLSAADIDRISTMPRRWEWGPPGTLTVPMPTAPASVIVRTRQAGVAVTELAVFADGSATFADGTGTLSHADGALTVGTTKSVEVEGVIAYPDVVSEAETDRIAAIEYWSWNGIVDRVPYILRFTLPEPFVISRSTLPEPFVISRTIKRE